MDFHLIRNTPLRRTVSLLIGFILIFGLRLSAQENKQMDSLWSIVHSYKGTDPATLKKKKQQLSDMFGVAQNGEMPEALRVTDSLAETCRLLGDSSAYYEALYRNKAIIYSPVFNYVKTFDYLIKYANALQRIGEKNGYAYIDIGNQYFSLSLYDNAIQYYKQADRIFAESNNNGGRCTIYDNLGAIWEQKGNEDSSMFWLKKSLALRRDSLRDPYLEAYSYLAIGKTLNKFGKQKEGISYLLHCSAIMSEPAFEKYKDFVTFRSYWVSCEGTLAQLYLEQDKPDSARFHLDKAIRLADLYDLGSQRMRQHFIEAKLLMKEKRNGEALPHIQEGERAARIRNDGYSLLSVYELYAACYEANGNFKKANEYYRDYFLLSDSLNKAANDDQMLVVNNTILQMENEGKIANQKTELNIKEAEAVQTEREKRNLLLGMAGLILLILLIVFFLIQFRKKNKLIEKYNHELEQANRTKEKFLSVISHDLRTPFNTLIGMSNVMVTNIKNHKHDQLAANAEAINESSRKAYVLLDNLMQWVSIQKEKININKEDFPVVSLVDEVLILFRNQALAQSITIEKDIRTGIIYSDRNLLQVVLRNLLSNAIRHIPVGGKVIVRIEAAGSDVRILIEDNGNGIDAETIQMLFNKKTGMNIARKGGGLGLELVHEFVLLLGGTIQAENITGSGARFTILLNGASPGEANKTEREMSALNQFELSGEDKKRLAPIISEIRKYEIFDTTELRKLLEETIAGETEMIAEWKKRMQNAVYHSDSKQFEWLINIAQI